MKADHLNHIEDGVTALSEEIVQTVVGTEVGEKCAEYAALFNDTDKVESFIFFTDPHLTEGRSGYESQMRSYLKTLKTYYDATPTNFVVCGGDWLGAYDTKDEACFKLGFINGTMRSLVEPYYPVVGNHDTNYQGKSTAESTELDGVLTNETIRNLFVPGEEKTYYAFDGANTRFYVLDTGSDWDGTMNAYRVEQIAWLANMLKTDNDTNRAVLMHIGYAASNTEFPAVAFASNVMKLCNAFNNNTSVTISNVTYDFQGDSNGKVRFAMCGHVHADHNDVVNGIPLIAVTKMRDGGKPTFDLCLADYNANTLRLVRVGNGESRNIPMWTESESGEATYTNLVTTLLDYDSDAVYNNGLGYKNNVTSLGEDRSDAGIANEGTSFLTGLLPYTVSNRNAECLPIYIKVPNFDEERALNQTIKFSIQHYNESKERKWYCVYAPDKAETGFYGYALEKLGNNYFRLTVDAEKVITAMGTGTKYISIYGPGTGDGMVMTLDEPIE